jgi:eukaryotic-like serine/threonine-protein kinase
VQNPIDRMAHSSTTDRDRTTVVLGGRPVPDARDTLVPGDHVGPFRIVRRLARGGMGSVFEAQHRWLDRPVALKVAHSRADDSGSSRDRFLREARFLSCLDHDGVVYVHDFGALPDGRAWIAMELLRGATIAQIADRELVEARRAVRWLRSVARTVSTAHAAGVVHRDLKPDNLFVTADDRIKVIDWGIAFVRPESGVRLTRGGLLLGTPKYIAPEQARGLEVDGRADVYSLGVVAYELLSHRLPFDGPTDVDIAAQHVSAAPPPLSAVWPECPPRLDALVMAMLAKEPAERPGLDEAERELGVVEAETAL